MIKAVIIDPNSDDRKILSTHLGEWDDLEIVAEADDLISGIRIINTHQPQLVFSEIELPESSGFRLMEGFDEINFEVIFISNRKKDAIRAFKVAAAGYIIKPVTKEKLHRPLDHILKVLSAQQLTANSRAEKNRFVLPAPSGFHYLVPSEVGFLTSDGKQTIIHKLDKTKLIVPKSLKDCLSLINDPIFIRIHRSSVINLEHIKQYNRGIDTHVIISNGVRLDVGKQFKTGLDEVVNQVIR